MIVGSVKVSSIIEPRYRGLRLSADEYFQLDDDGFRYELVDGVVCMSPSPTPAHQAIVLEIGAQIRNHLQQHPLGKVYVELDVQLRADLVYRPDVIFLQAERAQQCRERVVGPPDLIVEVVSPDSKRYDAETKRGDYERCGVAEYWMIDPQRDSMVFLRLQGERYVEIKPTGNRLASEAVPGFTLDIERLRKAFSK